MLYDSQLNKNSIVLPAEQISLRELNDTLDLTNDECGKQINFSSEKYRDQSNLVQNVQFGKKRRKIVNAKIQIQLSGSREERVKQRYEINQKTCRICLDFDSSEDNPLVTPCKCTGSLKYIHLECIRQWTNNRKQTYQSVGIASYYWSNLSCEICKSRLLTHMFANGKLLELLDVPRPQSSCYMILQSENKSSQRAIHVLDFSACQVFQIGRRAKNQISIADASVSRDQAMIQFEEKSKTIQLHDKKSKYGSFVKVRKLLKITQNKQTRVNNQDQGCVQILIGKTCYLFTMQNRFTICQKLYQCILNQTVETQFDYFDQQVEKFPKKFQTLIGVSKDDSDDIEKKLQKLSLNYQQVKEESQSSILVIDHLKQNGIGILDETRKSRDDQCTNFVISEENICSSKSMQGNQKPSEQNQESGINRQSIVFEQYEAPTFDEIV